MVIGKVKGSVAQRISGGVAQLARALDLHSRGHRFDSVHLHGRGEAERGSGARDRRRSCTGLRTSGRFDSGYRHKPPRGWTLFDKAGKRKRVK